MTTSQKAVVLLLAAMILSLGLSVLMVDHRVRRLEVIIDGVFSGGNRVEPR